MQQQTMKMTAARLDMPIINKWLSEKLLIRYLCRSNYTLPLLGVVACVDRIGVMVIADVAVKVNYTLIMLNSILY
jgi:hypothetical protein